MYVCMYLEKDDDVLCTHSARKGRGERAWPRRDCGTHILYGTSATAIARDHRPATLCVRPALAVLCVPVGGLSPAYRRWYGTFDPMQMIPAQHTILPHAASSVRAHHDVSPAPNRPDQTDQTDWYSLQAPKPPPPSPLPWASRWDARWRSVHAPLRSAAPLPDSGSLVARQGSPAESEMLGSSAAAVEIILTSGRCGLGHPPHSMCSVPVHRQDCSLVLCWTEYGQEALPSFSPGPKQETSPAREPSIPSPLLS